MKMNINDVIVVVHPSFPWESRGDLPPHEREWHLQQCGLVLSRIAEAICLLPLENRILIGPYVQHASYLPELVTNDLVAISEAVPPMNIHGRRYGVTELDEAAKSVAEQIQRLRHVRRIAIAGFYREMCCRRVAHRIVNEISSGQIHIAKTMTI